MSLLKVRIRRLFVSDTFSFVPSQISIGLDNLTLSDFSPGSSALSTPLCIQPTGPIPTTSSEWLKTHGLKAQKLDLYQLLARNAYSPQETFVPVLGKTVSSTVHERVMVRFEWHDGTVKYLHVDLPSVQKYQVHFINAVHLFERRVQWLNRIWGTVCEQRVQVLLDMSGMNAHYQLHLQHALRILLQEQLANKHSFNIIVFGSDVKSWQEKVVPSTHENLQAVWHPPYKTMLNPSNTSMPATAALCCSNIKDAVSVYVTVYVSERCSATNLNLHVCLFTGEEDTARCPPPRYTTRTETTRNGRFLWMTETELVFFIVQSADIGTPTRLSRSADQRKTNVPRSVFFMEDGNLGVVFNKYPKPKSVCTSITTIKLPKHEDICSAKQWLKRFGTKNLKLDLHKLISGPSDLECCHHNKLVLSVHKRVSAKYCAIFPSVLINAPENTNPALIRKLLSADDLRKLSEEIEKLRMFQKQAKAFRETILESRNQEGM
ncbi:von Willebrand factor A domain-containing protein 3A [Sinocyclocheilus anshuiensis]|uniref:von Willebrand factor A domain-containing protein 3A n=1 Tax=Sinocyclocheilus anshuiensis TaxID=1608454 RepID=UPI0007BA7914|nr:PREDICTED: von Willebrand factor A domain-containing protein 3A [Sinocyclocheilus anshuiensis]